MSLIDSLRAAQEGLRQSFEAGRLAHAYVVIGSPRGDALALTESFLQFLFCRTKERPCGHCAECVRVKEHAHPDILWVRPESKSRRISIEQIREDLMPRIAQTSYGGGWKVGVILNADRLTDDAANAFLKTLEEPLGSSLLMLLTDQAQHLLPTILSRCQRILLSTRGDPEDDVWRERLLELLRRSPPADSIEALTWSGRLKTLLEDVKARVIEEEKALKTRGPAEEDEDVAAARLASRVLEERSKIMRCVLLWQRDVLVTVMGSGPRVLHFADDAEAVRRQAHGLTYAEAMARIRAVEAMVRRLERNLPEEAVFEFGFREDPAEKRL
jgi:DNA polymerase III subunit delta'